MTLWLALLVKTSLLLGGALVAALCARHASASLRHAILAAGVAGALMLPASLAIVPAWELPPDVVPPLSHATTRADVDVLPAASVGRPQGAPSPSTIPWLTIAGSVWIAGSVATLAFLSIGLRRLRRLGTAALPAGTDWDCLAQSLGATLGVERPVRVLIGAAVRTPVTWGLRHPRILLPQDARDWPEARRRIVLAHELVHIARGDWFIHLAGEVLCAAYWFNPLAWTASRRRKDEAERACDDRVLALGVNGVDYAAALVDLARSAQRKSWLPAPAVVRTPHLERRVRAMLNPQLNRAALSRTGRAALAGITLVTIVLLSAVSAAQTLASLGGSLVDPHNAVLPGVQLVLTKADSDTRIEVRSDRNGRFEFPPLEPGEYRMEAVLPGFSTFRSTIRLEGGQRVEPNLQLSLGTLSESVTVIDSGTPAAEGPPRVQEVPRPRPVPACLPATGDGLRIGGNIRPPAKIRNVAPVYPRHLSGSGESASVVLNGIIGPDGTLEELQTMNEPSLDFENAALEAVRQWAFDQTLLNGCPHAGVKVNILVRFSSR